MANTFNKSGIAIKGLDSYLSYFIARHEEAANQTFLKDSPLIMSGGRIAVAASPVAVGSLVGFARKAGNNKAAAADNLSEYVMAVPGLQFYANFLAAAAADNVLAQADFGADFRIVLNGTSWWYVEDNATTATCEMLSGETDSPIPNVVAGSRAVAGDTNARVLFQILNSALAADA